MLPLRKYSVFFELLRATHGRQGNLLQFGGHNFRNITGHIGHTDIAQKTITQTSGILSKPLVVVYQKEQ